MEPYTLLVSMQNGAPTLENSLPVPQVVKQLLYDPANESYVYTNTCTQMFTAVLFIIIKWWEQSKYPLTNEWIKTLYIHRMNYHST